MYQLSMELIRVTEAAAVAASRWIGTGEEEKADRAATQAMRDRLNRINFAARVVIGEERADHGFGLFYGEIVGRRRDCVLHGDEPHYEICVDPIEGTHATVTAGPDAISALGVADGERALLATEYPSVLQLVYGPRIARTERLRVDAALPEILSGASRALGKPVEKIVVCVLDRPIHNPVMEELRRIGARIKLVRDCDVSAAVATCLPESGIDLLYGVGHASRAVIAACAIKCLGGVIQVQVTDNESCAQRGAIYETKDLVRGDCIFAATGITSGSLLQGVRFTERGAVTHSVFMRSASGTVRWMTADHGN